MSRKLNEFRARYETLPEDPHLFAGEGERFRRYARFLINPAQGTLERFKHDSFFQAKEYDQLYGDIHRHFAPLNPEDYESDFLQMLVMESYRSLPIPESQRLEPFEVSVHMIRIAATTRNNIGRPAPEGIHRDGYHFGSIHLMNRTNIQGDCNYIYDLNQKEIDRFKLERPLDSIYFDDRAIFHGVSPFQAVDPRSRALRDMLILLYQPLAESPQRDRPRMVLRRF